MLFMMIYTMNLKIVVENILLIKDPNIGSFNPT